MRIRTLLATLIALCGMTAQAQTTYPYYIYDEDTHTASVCPAFSSMLASGQHMGDFCDQFVPDEFFYGDIVVPETVTKDGVEYTVTSMEPLAFSHQYYITSVTLPATITTIRTTNLVIFEVLDMKVPESSGLFYNCFSLKRITFLGDDIKSLGAGAFFACINLEDLRLPAGLERVNDGMFAACYSLEEIRLPQNVSEVGYYAFTRCGIPEEGSIGSGYSSMDELFYTDMYWDSTLREGYESVASALFTEYYGTPTTFTFESLRGKGIRRVIMPKTLTGIKYGAFREAYQLELLTQVDDPATAVVDAATPNDLSAVEKLGEWVFSRCEKLTNLTLSNTAITSIPNSTFTQCWGLETVTLPKTLLQIDQRAFLECESLTSINYEGVEMQEGVVNLPPALEHIGARAFEGALSRVDEVQLPTTIKRLSTHAFATLGLTGQHTTRLVCNSPLPPVLGRLGSGIEEDEIKNSSASYFYESDRYTEVNTDPVTGGHTVFPTLPNSQQQPITLPAGSARDYSGIGYDDTFNMPLWYERTVTENDYGTLCVEFEATQAKEFVFYAIDHKTVVNGVVEKLTVVELEPDELLVAGQPYFFKAKQTDLYVEQITDGEVVDAPLDGAGFYGTFEGASVPGTGYFKLQDNKIVSCVSGDGVGEHRAYIRMDEVPEEGLGDATRNYVVFDVFDLATGISAATSGVSAAPAYDLAGRRAATSSPRAIVVVNGKKIIP